MSPWTGATWNVSRVAFGAFRKALRRDSISLLDTLVSDVHSLKRR